MSPVPLNDFHWHKPERGQETQNVLRLDPKTIDLDEYIGDYELEYKEDYEEREPVFFCKLKSERNRNLDYLSKKKHCVRPYEASSPLSRYSRETPRVPYHGESSYEVTPTTLNDGRVPTGAQHSAGGGRSPEPPQIGSQVWSC